MILPTGGDPKERQKIPNKTILYFPLVLVEQRKIHLNVKSLVFVQVVSKDWGASATKEATTEGATVTPSFAEAVAFLSF